MKYMIVTAARTEKRLPWTKQEDLRLWLKVVDEWLAAHFYRSSNYGFVPLSSQDQNVFVCWRPYLVFCLVHPFF